MTAVRGLALCVVLVGCGDSDGDDPFVCQRVEGSTGSVIVHGSMDSPELEAAQGEFMIAVNVDPGDHAGGQEPVLFHVEIETDRAVELLEVEGTVAEADLFEPEDTYAFWVEAPGTYRHRILYRCLDSAAEEYAVRAHVSVNGRPLSLSRNQYGESCRVAKLVSCRAQERANDERDADAVRSVHAEEDSGVD